MKPPRLNKICFAQSRLAGCEFRNGLQVLWWCFLVSEVKVPRDALKKRCCGGLQFAPGMLPGLTPSRRESVIEAISRTMYYAHRKAFLGVEFRTGFVRALCVLACAMD